MKILFDYCHLNLKDSDGILYNDWGDVKFGIGWLRHSKRNKWFGFDLVLHFYPWRITITFVDNWKEYDKKINSWKYRNKK